MARGLPADRPTGLSPNEEVTLRRVAYGQSDIAHLRAQDLVRLRALNLIDGSPRVPALTPQGKQRFDTLPKSHAAMPAGASDDLMAMLGRLMTKK